jgi:uncharacterized protein (TIGR03083 family)
VTDYEGPYRELRLRVIDLLRGRPDAVVEQVAPATPEWRLRDVAAHLGGVCDDIAHGNIEGIATDAWTGAQVEKRREWPFARVLDDWAEQAGVVEPTLNDIGHPIGQMVFDAWTHEQDIRGALGEPGGRDSAAAEISLQWFVDVTSSGSGTAAENPGALRVILDGKEHQLGVGAPVTTVRTSRFEFLRAVTGRRSRAQVRAFDREGADLDGVIFFHDFFTPAAADIVE